MTYLKKILVCLWMGCLLSALIMPPPFINQASACPDVDHDQLQFIHYNGPFDYSGPLVPKLIQLRSQGNRQGMIEQAIDFINGKWPYQGGYVQVAQELDGGLLGKLVAIHYRLSHMDERMEWENVQPIITDAMGMSWDDIAALLKTQAYLKSKDNYWDCYFALTLVMGYEIEFLEEILKGLTICHLLEFAAEAQSPPTVLQLGGMFRAILILPDSIFPLPAANSADTNLYRRQGG